MAFDNDSSTPAPLFTHKCQIKNVLATLILDNGNQKNLVAQDLVTRLSLPTTPHPAPYHLGWVQKDGPRLMVSQRCAVTFAIGPFRDTILCDVSPLDCADLLLGIPYQEEHNAFYLARNHQYHFQLEGHTYVLTNSTPKAARLLSVNAAIRHVSLNQCHHLFLVRSVKDDVPSQSIHPEMKHLLS